MFLFKAHQQAHSRLRNCCCNVEDGHKGKLVAEVISSTFLDTIYTPHYNLRSENINKLITVFQRLISILSGNKIHLLTADKPIQSAAVPAETEAEPIHPGKRRLKENYTNHWDLDYLPRKQVEELMKDNQEQKDN